MGRRVVNNKGRRSFSTFVLLPHMVIRSKNYLALSHIARSLLIDMADQYDGANNGNLDARWSRMTVRGWKSKTTLSNRIDELIYYGFIVKVQQGGINVGGKKRPNLFALGWQPIDKVGYSDDFQLQSVWTVGQTPGEWKFDKPDLYPPKAKRKSPHELSKPN